MATPQLALLALYAALDRLVVEHPETAPQVERLLPGTTAPDQRGWSMQLLPLVRQLSDPPSADWPHIDEALRAFAPPPEAAEFAGSPGTPALTAGQQARLQYVIGALLQLPVAKTDETFALSGEALSRCGSSGEGASLLETLAVQGFRAREEGGDALAAAVGEALVAEQVKESGLPCANWVQQTGTERCAVLRTDVTSSDVTIQAVKNIVDPLNWGKCLPNFFCEMEPLVPPQDKDGFSRVLEHVSFDCAGEHLKTALKYWKGETEDGAAYVNYELDDDDNRKKTDDSLLVTVDRGTILMTPTADGGVRVQTTKHVKIEGFSVAATTMWCCVLGWSDIGKHMLFDCAKNPPRELKEWKRSEPPAEAMCVSPPKFPVGMRKELVERSVDMLAGCIEDASKMTYEFANRWLTGQMQPQDYAKISDDIGRLAGEPWRLLAKAAGQIGRSPTVRPPEPDQQRGGGS